MGFITNTDAGKFRANWRNPAGKQKARTFRTKKEARAFLNEVEGAIHKGTYVDPNAGRIRFGDFATRWLLSRDVEARTAERTLSLMRTHLLPRWADWPLNRIDYMSVQEWVSDLSKELAPATVAKCYGALMTVLKTAVRARLIAHNPAEDVKVPGGHRETRTRGASISREEFFGKLLPGVPTEHRAIICAAAGTGLRWGECAGLRWDAVNWDGWDLPCEEHDSSFCPGCGQRRRVTLRVAQVAVETPAAVTLRPYPKTWAGVRTVPVPGFLACALRAHRYRPGADVDPSSLVFVSEAGTPLRRSNFRRRVWLPAVKKSGLPTRFRFHDLRHSYATWLVSDGVPVNAVQRVMGHAQASTTLNRYTHAPRDYEDRVRAVLDADADFSLTSGAPDDPEEGDEPGAACPVPA